MTPLSRNQSPINRRAPWAPGWGRRAAAVAVATQALVLPAPAFANYGGNYYGGSQITLIVCGVMAAVAILWAVWFGVSRLRRPQYEPTRLATAAERRALYVDQRVAYRPRIIRPAATAEPDVADELTKLANLRDRGVLNTTEFEAQKAKLLATG